MDKSAFRKHRILNTAQTALLMFGMSLLLGALGWFLGGATGVLLAVSGVFVSLMFAPSMSPRFILRLYNAQMLTSRDAPDLFAVLDSLARRAQLEREPELYYVPSPIINAFAVGSRDA
ncbi:MAG: peptidase M48, partial [Gammaproteobacteria bacterium]|nr:peptidase M48 [Gammaproteobacteria bacterium]